MVDVNAMIRELQMQVRGLKEKEEHWRMEIGVGGFALMDRKQLLQAKASQLIIWL